MSLAVDNKSHTNTSGKGYKACSDLQRGWQGDRYGCGSWPEGHLFQVCRHRSEDRRSGSDHRSSGRYSGHRGITFIDLLKEIYCYG